MHALMVVVKPLMTKLKNSLTRIVGRIRGSRS